MFFRNMNLPETPEVEGAVAASSLWPHPNTLKVAPPPKSLTDY
jgi:hypothetical protein